jgi:hypothetical protein
MSATDGSTRRPRRFELHEIRVQGHLDERWTDWLEGLAFTHESDGTTTLMGPLADQAALHGVVVVRLAVDDRPRRSCINQRGGQQGQH